MGSISDIMLFGDFRRFRSWMLAVAVAILGVALLQAIGVADMANSMHLSPSFGWLGNVVGGVGIGLVVVAGWTLTGLAQDDFADVPVALISLSYVRPTGDTLDYLMRYSALGAPGFGVVTLAGVILGGFLGAASQGRLHLTTFADPKDSARNMFGAAFMGIGGVLALGCTVG